MRCNQRGIDVKHRVRGEAVLVVLHVCVCAFVYEDR